MIVERVETAELSAATYRTARRLLDRANDGTGHLRMAHADLRTICQTEADGTARRQLIELQAAGIITYRRNSDVQIWFADWRSDNVISGDQPSSAVISGDHQAREMITPRAPLITSGNGKVSSGDHHTREMITTRSKRAHSDHLPHTHASAPDLDRQTDRLHGDPSVCLSVPAEAPGPEEQVQSVALLRDREVRLDPANTKRLAAAHPFERIRYCVGAWYMNRRPHGKLDSTGAIIYWLDNWPHKEPNRFTEADWRKTPLYHRHRPPDEAEAEAAGVSEDEAERRRKYIPDEFSDIAIG